MIDPTQHLLLHQNKVSARIDINSLRQGMAGIKGRHLVHVMTDDVIQSYVEAAKILNRALNSIFNAETFEQKYYELNRILLRSEYTSHIKRYPLIKLNAPVK